GRLLQTLGAGLPPTPPRCLRPSSRPAPSQARQAVRTSPPPIGTQSRRSDLPHSRVRGAFAGRDRQNVGTGGQKRKTAIANLREAPSPPAAPRRRAARRARCPPRPRGTRVGP